MTQPPTSPTSMTPIYDQLLREQEQRCADDRQDDTGPDQPAEAPPSEQPS